MAVHVFAMTDDQIQSASRIWNIDFVHKWHDHRSHGDIDWDNDTLIFADNATLLVIVSPASGCHSPAE